MLIGVDYTAAVRQKAGIGRYVRELFKHLGKIDRQNLYILLVPSDSTLHPLPANFRYLRLPFSERVMYIFWQRLRIPLPAEAFTGPLALFHSPDFVLPPLAGTPSILTIHDLSFLRVPGCFTQSLLNYLSKAVPRSVRRANFILADSENTRKDLMELMGVQPGRVEVLYAGVGESFKPSDGGRARARYGLPERFILSLGTLEPRKNFARLIRAFARLKRNGLKLVIAGRKGWLYEEIFKAVEECGLENDVIFPGYVEDEDLPSLYSAAELFVYPSIYEGFGLPPLEAMACGTPVVASEAPPLPEVLGDAALFFPPYDEEALASAMEKALLDDGLRRKLREKGFARSALFSWEKSAQKLLEIYSRLGKKR